MSVKILQGDCREVLKTLDAESVDCVVTSPPYYGLRDYGVSGQIGLEETPDAYVKELVATFAECRRVLKATGTLWLNLGDSYAGSGKGGNPEAGKQATNKSSQSIGVLYGTGRTAREAAVTNVTRKSHEIGLKPKDLIGIPWLVAFALRNDGWYLRSDIIWSKPNPMPESVTDRPTKAHEYLFLLSKSQRYFFNASAVREDALEPKAFGPNSLANVDRVPVSRKIKIPGGWDRGEGAHGTIHRDGRTSAEYQEAEVQPGRNIRSVWTVATAPFPEAHFATFPPDLIEPCIKAGCPVGGTVLDPFGGAGTTGLVADRLQRNATLIELNPDYIEIAKRRIADDRGALLDAMEAA